MNVVQEVQDLYGIQGIRIVLPRGFRLPSGDIAVFESESVPEYIYYKNIINKYNIPIIFEKNPYTALFKALVFPKQSFKRTIIGIDPGARCGTVVLSDGIVILARKPFCNQISYLIKKIIMEVPSMMFEVLVGDGEGLGEVLQALEILGVRYGIVEETSSTREPAHTTLAKHLKDKDLAAGLTIALRGGYSGVFEPVWIR